MSLNRAPLFLQQCRSQAGFLMPLAAFIIVTLGIMGVTISRFSAQTSVSYVQELISAQTFYAAESGAQYALNQLFYDTASAMTRTQADLNCAAADSDAFTLSGTGFTGCNVVIDCSINTVGVTSFYTIRSSASCGQGDVSAQRSIEVSSFIQ